MDLDNAFSQIESFGIPFLHPHQIKDVDIEEQPTTYYDTESR